MDVFNRQFTANDIDIRLNYTYVYDKTWLRNHTCRSRNDRTGLAKNIKIDGETNKYSNTIFYNVTVWSPVHEKLGRVHWHVSCPPLIPNFQFQVLNTCNNIWHSTLFFDKMYCAKSEIYKYSHRRTDRHTLFISFVICSFVASFI